jgi:type II secretory pathway component PulK
MKTTLLSKSFAWFGDPGPLRAAPQAGSHARQTGSVLVIVLWIAFGLVSVALYFGHSMLFEFRASDNNAAGLEAEQTIEGAARYVTFVLTNVTDTATTNLTAAGTVPDPQTYKSEEVLVGDEAAFWMIGRSDKLQTTQGGDNTPYFGLVDEASKLNLNIATAEMLQLLPRMTAEFAAAIIDWRDEDSEATQGGAESETYARRTPPYRCKNANFETVEELRLVYGADAELLYGEDLNRNGVLDANENDGSVSQPEDNKDGRLDPGLMEYLTVYSREPNKRTDGSARINVNTAAQPGDTNGLAGLLVESLGQQRATEITQRIGAAVGTFRSVLEFYVRSGMTELEFGPLADSLTTTNATSMEGLVNINTAPAAVLACVPGIGVDKADQVVAYRQSQTLTQLESVAWLKEVLDDAGAIQAGPYITTKSYQFTADIAAVGRHGRGYRRTMFVFDTSEGAPKIIYRRDLSGLGWALGTYVRQRSTMAMETR